MISPSRRMCAKQSARNFSRTLVLPVSVKNLSTAGCFESVSVTRQEGKGTVSMATRKKVPSSALGLLRALPRARASGVSLDSTV